MKQRAKTNHPDMGFQIAPMIDVVFVIMLFFMVMAGAVKVERELKTQLPGIGTPNLSNEDTPPDEIIVTVEETGVVTLNEEEFDTADNKTLPNFTGTLMKLKQEADLYAPAPWLNKPPQPPAKP